MNTLETARFRLKVIFVVVAFALLVAVPLLAPYAGIGAGKKVDLSRTQVLYGVLSSEFVLAIYIWGVGNWSRFEPPQANGSVQGVQPTASPSAQQNVVAVPQPPGAPPRQQGGQ